MWIAVHYARQAAVVAPSAAPGRRARCPHPGFAHRDFAILPQELQGFILCAEDHVSADVLTSDRGCLSGRGSLI